MGLMTKKASAPTMQFYTLSFTSCVTLVPNLCRWQQHKQHNGASSKSSIRGGAEVKSRTSLARAAKKYQAAHAAYNPDNLVQANGRRAGSFGRGAEKDGIVDVVVSRRHRRHRPTRQHRRHRQNGWP